MIRKKNAALVLTGVLVGTILTGPAVHAAEEYFKAYRSNQAIYLDGQQIQLEAYAINGSNYVKLRDIGAALDFNVYWDGAVQIDSDAPYTGTATAQPQPEAPTAPQEYTIHTDHWSREDFSQYASPVVFADTLDRELYNTMRQTLVDEGKQDGAGYEYAYTMVSKDDYSAVKQLMGRLDCGTTYDHYVPPNLKNYYEYLDYFAMSAGIPENYKAAIEFIQPAIQAANQLETDAGKVTYLNNYLKTLLEYDREHTAGITKIFSPRSGEIKGACGSYARAFKVLCGEAGIPCFTISTDIHTWNMVCADGEWLHVDVSINDMPAGNTLLLERTALSRVDVAPAATEYLKELLVPGSTK